MEKIKVPQTTLVYPLSGSIVIRNIRNREVLLFCKSGKHVQNLNTPLKFRELEIVVLRVAYSISEWAMKVGYGLFYFVGPFVNE